MLKTRVIPALLLQDDALVKTVKFKKPAYIGDPINTVRIFNELEVDELVFLDITATNENRQPNYKVLAEIANECFMPLAYGGGINNLDAVKTIFDIGFEKVILNSILHKNADFVTKVAEHYGNQAVVASIDVRKNIWGKYEVWTNAGKINTKTAPDVCARTLESLGVGEILLTSIDREGTWAGLDAELTRKVADAVNVPVIAHGGAGNLEHFTKILKEGHASAIALGSMVVYQQKDMGVLINFPDENALSNAIE